MTPKIPSILFLGTLASHSALGAEAGAVPHLASSGSMGAAVFRMIGSLAFVVAVFFAGAWIFRNLHRFRAPNAPQRKLHILEARSLGARQAIYVVAFEQQRLLVGSSAQGITLLTHLPDGTPEAQSERIVPVPFGEALLHALGRK